MRVVFQHSAGLFLWLFPALFYFFVIVVIQYLNSSPPPSFPKARSSRVRNNNEKTSRTVCYFNYTHTHTTIVYTVHQLEDLAGHVVIATGCKKNISFNFSLSQLLLLFGPAGSPQLACSGSRRYDSYHQFRAVLILPSFNLLNFSLIFLVGKYFKKEREKNLACVFTLGRTDRAPTGIRTTGALRRSFSLWGITPAPLLLCTHNKKTGVDVT